MQQINYFYDRDQGIYELYQGDTLLVELPYCDPMTDQEAEELSTELFDQYINAQGNNYATNQNH